jgi:acid phosphatase
MTSHLRISRRSFLASTAALVLVRSRLARAAGPDLTFLVVGDWGSGTKHQRKVAVQMGKAAEAIGARFVISTGDNFYDDGVTSVDDPQWKRTFEDVYTAPSLMIPWYAALGNHDHRGNINAQVEYTKRSSRWRMPGAYYKHTETLADGSLADFFVLDTDVIGGEPDEGERDPVAAEKQLAWIERDLAASTARWKIAVGHHPVFSGGHHGNTEELVVRLKPLLERYGVQVYLNGHDHNLQHVMVGNVHYLTSGAGSRPRAAESIAGTRFALGNRLGFMTASLAPHAMDIAFIDGEGTTLYRASIPVTP